MPDPLKFIENILTQEDEGDLQSFPPYVAGEAIISSGSVHAL
jgi:hypothetical protein